MVNSAQIVTVVVGILLFIPGIAELLEFIQTGIYGLEDIALILIAVGGSSPKEAAQLSERL